MSSVLYKCNIGQNGRILLPAKLRKKLNLKIGDQIILTEEGNNVTLETLHSNIKKAQEYVKSCNSEKISLVDTLIEERKKDE